MKKYAIMIIIFVGIILFSFSFYYIYSNNNNSKNDINTLKSKVNQEIIYLNTSIISTMNKLNNISYIDYEIIEYEASSEGSQESQGSESSQQGEGGSSGGQQEQQSSEGSSSSKVTNMKTEYNGILTSDTKVDWKYMKREVELMYDTWTSILIDLSSLNINKDNLLKYNATLNNITKAVEKEDKKESLRYFADLYSLLVSYLREYSDDGKMINLYETKDNILHAYALVEYDDKWNEMSKYMGSAQNAYSNIINSGLQNSNNTNNINKAYILINELEKRFFILITKI